MGQPLAVAVAWLMSVSQESASCTPPAQSGGMVQGTSVAAAKPMPYHSAVMAWPFSPAIATTAFSMAGCVARRWASWSSFCST